MLQLLDDAHEVTSLRATPVRPRTFQSPMPRTAPRCTRSVRQRRYSGAMCTRYTLTESHDVMLKHFHIEGALVHHEPRYNIAPTQAVPAVRVQEHGKLELFMPRFGLVPPWAKDMSVGTRALNARLETVHEKPTFKHALHKKRCLLPADGYFEWVQEGRVKQPYWFRLDGGKLFAFAGLWERWRGPDGVLETCTMLTTAANGDVQPLHDRMPVILDEDAYDAWLDPDNDEPDLQALATPLARGRLRAVPVSRFVSNSKSEGPECIAPASA
jgi:putative SOS response-associated peptidase YedK